MTFGIKRAKEVDDRRIVFQVECLSCATQQDEGKEKESDSKEEVAEVAAFLAINEHDAEEERREDNNRQIHIVAERHNPSRERSTDIGTHDDGDGLRQGQETCIDERHRHHRGSGRTLHGTSDESTREHTRKSIGGHGSQDVSQL